MLLNYTVDVLDASRVVVLIDNELSSRLIRVYHDAPTGSHLGCEKSFAAITSDFY